MRDSRARLTKYDSILPPETRHFGHNHVYLMQPRGPLQNQKRATPGHEGKQRVSSRITRTLPWVEGIETTPLEMFAADIFTIAWCW